MILKNSFLISMKENIKRRNWVAALSMLAFFFYFPISILILIQGRLKQNELYHFENFFLKDSYGRMFQLNEVQLIFSAGIAIISAIQGFSYLYQKKKVDLYHSVPVSKNKRFGIIYLNGILIFSSTYLVNFLLGILTTVIFDGFHSDVFVNGLLGFAGNFLFFLCIYNIIILAVMMTGNLLTTVLAAAVFLFYELLFRLLISYMRSEYFSTYVYNEKTFSTSFLSPIGSAARLLSEYINVGENKVFLFFVEMTVLALVWGAAAYLAYRMRPSEASGKSMAFGKSKILVKIALMVPTSLFSAMFFGEMARNSQSMTILGLVIGILLSHAVIECIYEADLKAIFHKKRQMFIAGIIAVLVFLCFQLDIFGYDRYVPKTEKIESVGVYMPDDYMQSVYKENGSYQNIADYQLERVKVSDTQAIGILAKKAVDLKDADTMLTLTYNMKNGKQICRRVSVDYSDAETMKILNHIYANKEYKEQAYQIYDSTFFGDYVNMHMYYGNGVESVALQESKIPEFLDIYKKEFIELDYNKRVNETPILEISFEYVMKNEESGENSILVWDYPVYDSFLQTITFLEENGDYPLKELTSDIIDEIVLVTWENDTEVEIKYENVSETSVMEGVSVFESKEELELIIPYLIPASFKNYRIGSSYGNYDIQVSFVKDAVRQRNSNSRYYKQGFEFPDGVIPDVIKQKIIQKITQETK